MDTHHKLSIRLLPGGFCFSNVSSEVEFDEEKFVNIVPGADYEKRLEDAILDLEINVGEDDVDCFVETSRMSLSPTDCDDMLAEEMFRLTLRETDSEEKILHETSLDGSIRISFGIDIALYNFLIRTYQYINFHHPIIKMINDEKLMIHASDNWMTVKSYRDMLYLLAYKNKHLQLANCVETMVTQNRAYHILNTWTQLDLDVLSDTLYILGKDSDKAKIKNAVSKFIKLCE